MGQRSIIGHVSANDTLSITTVHWATILDATIGHYLASSRKDGVALEDSLNEIFTAVLKNRHISSLEIYDEDQDEERTVLGHGVGIIYGDNEGSTAHPASLLYKLLEEHLNLGSIAAISFEKEPEIVQFYWWDDDRTKLETAQLTAGELAEFYSDLMEEGSQLMPTLNGRSR